MLVKNNNIIAEQIPKLKILSDVQLSTSPKKSCNCGAKQNITTPDANKQMTENLLSSLTSEDFIQIKTVLGLEELCYYRRTADKLELICT
jgi:hypothetical protein